MSRIWSDCLRYKRRSAAAVFRLLRRDPALPQSHRTFSGGVISLTTCGPGGQLQVSCPELGRLNLSVETSVFRLQCPRRCGSHDHMIRPHSGEAPKHLRNFHKCSIERLCLSDASVKSFERAVWAGEKVVRASHVGRKCEAPATRIPPAVLAIDQECGSSAQCAMARRC